MNENTTAKKINIGRRAIGIAIASTPILLAIACAFSPKNLFPRFQKFGLGLVLLALALGCLNCYLSFIRPLIHQCRGETKGSYRNVSGFPVLGTILQIAGAIVGFGSPLIGATGLLATLIDTCGLPWFVACTWKDQSFWDS